MNTLDFCDLDVNFKVNRVMLLYKMGMGKYVFF